MSRVGFDNVVGFLDGGFEAWVAARKEVSTIKSIEADRLKTLCDMDDQTPIIDVRKPSEYAAEHISSSMNLPLSNLNEHLSTIPINEDVFLHCAGGYRSVIAISILKARGIHNVIDVSGGFKAIKNTSIATSDYVCPTSL